MANKKLSALTELAETPASGDMVPVVDVSDTTGAATGTTKRVSVDNLISNIAVADMAASAVVLESEGISSNDNDTTLPTSAAVKDYVDGTTHLSLGTTSSTALAGDTTTITTGQASAITANTAKTGITSGQASEITANTAKVTNATHTGEVTGSGALTIADDIVDEANLLVGGTLANDNVLTADSAATGGMKWAAATGGGTLTTKGDLEAYTTTQTRLAVGTDDYVLTADASAASGIAWKAATGTSTFYVQNFNGDGSATAFTLSQTPTSENNTQVYISGVYQQKDTYTVSGTTLTFSAAPSTGTANVEVVTVSTSAIGSTTSDLVTFSPSGTGATNRTTQAKLRDRVSVKDFGATGDGSTDDTTNIQAALDAVGGTGQALFFPAGSYKITSKINVSSDSSMIGEVGTIIRPNASDFTNTVWNTYNPIIEIGDASTQYSNIVISGIRIVWASGNDGNRVDGIYARYVKDLVIKDCEIEGLPVGVHIGVDTLSGRSSITGNYLHDGTTSVDTMTGPVGSKPNLTGITVDDNRVLVGGTSTPSSGVEISGNTISDLTFTGAALTEWGYQTDGIHIAGAPGTDVATNNYRIMGNHISGCAEGVDTYGRNGVIANNTITDAVWGLKLIHGAQHNLLTGNTIKNSRYGGIVVTGGTASTGNTTKNIISNNVIDVVEPVAHTEATTAGIKVDDQSTTMVSSYNHFSNNSISVGANADYAVSVEDSSLSNTFIDNFVHEAGASGRYREVLASNKSRFVDANKTVVDAGCTTTDTVATATWTTIPFNSENIDTRNELDVATNIGRWTCECTGVYRFVACVRLASPSTIQVRLIKNGSTVFARTGEESVSDIVTLIADTQYMTEGDYVEVEVYQTSGGDRTLSGEADRNYLNIVTV